MQLLPRNCTAASLIVLGLVTPLTVTAQTDTIDTTLPIDRLTVPSGQSTHPSQPADQRTGTDPATARASSHKTAASHQPSTPEQPANPETTEPALAERIAALKHRQAILAQRLDKQATRFSRQLAEQAHRVEQLEQAIAQLRQHRQHAQTPRPSSTTDSGTETSDDAANGPKATETAADETLADTAARRSENGNTRRGDSCNSTLNDRFLFDVFYQASTDAELADARHAVQANNVDDWFVLPELERLYVGRYGTCQLARRRQAHVHERTGLSLRIDTVQPAPDASENADTTATQRHDAKTTTADAPFHIVGVEQRGLQTYLGLATATPTQPGDITWLQPGQVYYGWHLEAVHRYAGTASFAVDDQTVTVALPE